MAGLLVLSASCRESLAESQYLSPDLWGVGLDFRVGSLNDPNLSLTSVGDMAVSPSGKIFTLHGRSELAIRVFGPEGDFLTVFGRRGEGPGEFEGLLRLGFVGDTLWVLDHSLFRFSLFTQEGEFLRSFSVPYRYQEERGSPPVNAFGLLFDGRIWGYTFISPFELEDGTVTEQHTVLMTADGSVVDTVHTTPVGEGNWTSAPGGAVLRQPFRGVPLHDFFPREAAILTVHRDPPMDADEAELVIVKQTVSGDTVFVRDFRYEPDPIPRAEIDSILDANVTPTRSRAWLDDRLFKPRFRPPITSMILGIDGWVWLRGNPRENGGVRWFAFDPDGHPEGQVELPSNLRVFAVDAHRFWATEYDDLGVPYVVRYSVTRE